MFHCYACNQNQKRNENSKERHAGVTDMLRKYRRSENAWATLQWQMNRCKQKKRIKSADIQAWTRRQQTGHFIHHACCEWSTLSLKYF